MLLAIEVNLTTLQKPYIQRLLRAVEEGKKQCFHPGLHREFAEKQNSSSAWLMARSTATGTCQSDEHLSAIFGTAESVVETTQRDSAGSGAE